jgi:uncharacterized protein YggE
MMQRTEKIGIAILVLVLVVLAGLAGMFYVRTVAAQPAGGGPGVRHVTVVGRGEVMGRPDTASVRIGVTTEAISASAALEQNSAEVQAVLEQLKQLAIAEEDIQTSTFSIHPSRDDNREQITGYRVSNTVTVTIRDLSQAGQLLDQVVQAGANQIGGISFSVADPQALLAQARAEAVRDARAQAEQLAQAAGVALGEVLAITENVGSQPPMPPLGRTIETAGGATPIEPGEQQFTAVVQVTFALP